ncbi:ABC transporter permease [Rhodoferax sp. PAMC 29310]|uniref:ABC transporter permease n=1 Tax=Rhodoferax sp. PAMC 29310 TaxID=2822760 RepID=UPI001B31B4CB|nr:ABC transporter permease [Rhodoferax sp. PAMC 29310]
MSNLVKAPAKFLPYVGLGGKIWHYGFRGVCAAIFFFLLAPVFVIVPLAFNSEPYFNYPIKSYSLRWFQYFLNSEMWFMAIKNSILIGVSATIIATILGTIAAIGLSRRNLPYKAVIMAVLISPMIVPVVITAVGTYFFYSKLGIANSLLGIILAHAALGVPFVVITVTATLVGFDQTLVRAARGLGASPFLSFRKVTLPLVWPGILSGALFAFTTSFDDVVVVLFLGGVQERTIPRQMWTELREQLSPTILVVATILIALSALLLVTLELLRRRNARMRGLAE